MRELNPRAWSIDGECWCTMVYYDGHKKEWSGIAPVLAPDNRSKRIGQIEDTNIIVEFPTGLKDKNGKEIYEGDIVKSSEHIGEVCQQGNGRWVIFCVKDKLHDDDLIVVGELECETYDLALTLGIEYCQVIGNIHENGDLLNVD